MEREYSTKAEHQGYIEPHAVVAQTGEDGRSTVWCSSQGHFGIRTYTTKVLGWEPGRYEGDPPPRSGEVSEGRPLSTWSPSPRCCRNGRDDR